MEPKGRKPGVAADWTRLPAHLHRSLPGLIVESSERLAVGQRWSVRESGRRPVRVQARYVEDARLEEGAGLRLRLERDPHSRNSETVFVIALDEQRTVVFQFGGPRHSSAPRGIAMKLQKALLLDGARSPVPLDPSAFHIDPRRFPDIQGTISWASEDWEITTVSASSLADGSWVEELSRRGLAIG